MTTTEIKTEAVNILATRYIEARVKRDECKTWKQEQVFHAQMERAGALARRLGIFDEFLAAIN